jgi:hypothetical protein
MSENPVIPKLKGYSSTLNSQFGVSTIYTRDARQADHRHGMESSLLRLDEQKLGDVPLTAAGLPIALTLHMNTTVKPV